MYSSAGRTTSGSKDGRSHGGKRGEKKRDGTAHGVGKEMFGSHLRIVQTARGENGNLMASRRPAASSAIRRSSGRNPQRAKQASVEVALKARRMISAISLCVLRRADTDLALSIAVHQIEQP